ncbi:MAG: tetratricopeptide repeat protein [Treponema sp.]|nr:tetratricopeptide repeat protein [Treponema sp.]
MPSLSALGQFRDSFVNIAREKEDVKSLSLPFDPLPLPKKEAPPFEYDRHDNSPGPLGASAAADEFDVNSFMNDLQGNDVPPADIAPTDDMSSGDALSALGGFLDDINSSAAQPEEDDSSPPDDLLAGFSDEMESAPADFAAEDTSADESPAEDFDMGDLGGENPETDEAPAEEFDMSSLGIDDAGTDEAPVEEFDMSSLGGDDTGTDEAPVEEFDMSSLGGDDAGTGDTPVEDFDMADLGGEDLGFADEDEEEDIGGIDLGGESPHSEELAADTDDFNIEPDSAFADELPADNASAEILSDDESLLDESFADDAFADAAPGDETAEIGAADDNIDLGGEITNDQDESTGDDFALPDMDFPDDGGDDSSALDSDFDSPLPDTDFSAAGDPFADDSLLGTGDDTSASIDFGGDLSSDFESDSIELSGETEHEAESHDAGVSNTSFGSDDFDLDGLDDILSKSAPAALKAPPPKKGLFGRKKEKAADVPAADDEIEEISLNQEELDNLLRTLSSYPLNLRITCEEIIAEQVIEPLQLSKLIRLLVNGASVKETAAHAESITGKPIIIPRSFEKGTGAAFEAEQSSFAYIFVHNFLPVLKIVAFVAVLAASVFYLSYKFIYTPLKAESIYKRGYERIPAGEYQRANELFHDAFTMHRKKKWFYSYAEAFRDQRRYMLAENKYDELLRYYPRDKKGVLDYANLNTYYLMNYDKANKLLQRELLDYKPDDFEGLLAAGDNFMAWADSDPSRFYDRYEDARFSYARLLEKYGWLPPVVERMMTYFIRTDNLKEVLQLRVWFENDPKRRHLSPPSLTELAGYLLDKQLEKPTGVPNPYVESIASVRAMLLQAIGEDPYLPEAHYHLARYYNNLNNTYEERLTLENSIRAFDLAKQESVRRRLYRADTHYRYANLLINNREFFPADEQLVKGIELFEDFLNRNLTPASPQLGQMYSLRGDLEYFVKSGNMEAALRNYHLAERYGYSPPEIQYRMGAAYYQREDWRNALEYLFKASKDLPLNRRLLYALGNAAFNRGDYFAANGYYNRLLDTLEVQRVRLPVLMPNDNAQFLEVGERLMMARNNAGVVNEALADQTGNREYRSRAMTMYAESSGAWSAITRNPQTMTRMRLTDSPGAPSINLGYLNANNALRPNSGYKPQIFVRIDRDVLEPSKWEELAPFGGLQ